MAGIDYERLYEYRLGGIDQRTRQAVWREIAAHVYRRMGSPDRVLDPGAGRCEFINAIPAAERWAVDMLETGEFRDTGVKSVTGNILDVQLPLAHFDGVFVSNMLEHLPTPDAVGTMLARLRLATKPGGTLAVLGPNFKYCPGEYFDCADHSVALTHVSVVEHLHAAGFEVGTVIPRFLPYSFRGLLPPSRMLTRWYLRVPALWRLLGKQFLVIANRRED
jgi:ubiquinone/menaquinone biosynthesis C-methylase UbiE